MSLRRRACRHVRHFTLRPAARAATAVLGAGMLAVALVPTASAATPALTPSATSAPSRTVSFASVTVRVPATWPVVDVDGVPGCVRYDQHAVYLGSPSESTCPARIVGRTATVQILRAGAGAVAAVDASRRAHADPVAVAAGAAGPVALSTGPAAPVVLVTEGDDHEAAEAIAGSVRIDGTVPQVPAALAGSGATATGSAAAPATSGPEQSPLAQVAASAPTPAATVTGYGFDACYPPTLGQLDAWRGSPYTSIGAYIGGANYACAPKNAPSNLTASWVSAVAARGWHLLPIYVGLQAPCSGIGQTMSTNPTTAKNQGTAAANDAVAQMQSLGLAAGNPVYLDMESWNNANSSCTAATMAFTDAWTVGLHAAGYVSGFYSSADTGIKALVSTVQNQGSFHSPDAVWFAHWDNNPVTTDPNIPSTLWSNHRRAKQYQGNVYQTFGGRQMNIDTDYVDGPVTASAPALATTSLPVAVPNRAYSAPLAVRGGTAPYTFAITSGSLPSGLTLSKSGTISGTTATVTGGAPVTITVTDATGAVATGSYSLVSTFTDVPTTSGFFADIAWLANDGVTSGYSNGSFLPKNAVSRQAMAAFLYRYDHGADAGTCTGTAPFGDINPGSNFCGDIAWLKSSGISDGNGNGTFSPTKDVSRQAMAAFLYRYKHSGADAGACTGPSPFTDVPASSTFCGDIAWLASTGVTEGQTATTYGPSEAVSRQAMAAFLHRLSELPTS